MGFYTKPRLLSWETPLFPCVAWLMGALLGGDEAGFASSFIMRKSCEHGHDSMLLAGAGYGPASNKWTRSVVQLLLFTRVCIATCWRRVPPLPPCSAVLWFKFWRDSQCRRRSAPPMKRSADGPLEDGVNRSFLELQLPEDFSCAGAAAKSC